MPYVAGLRKRELWEEAYIMLLISAPSISALARVHLVVLTKLSDMWNGRGCGIADQLRWP